MSSGSESSIDEDELNALLFTDSDEDSQVRAKKRKERKAEKRKSTRKSSKDEKPPRKSRSQARISEKSKPRSMAALDDDLFGGALPSKSLDIKPATKKATTKDDKAKRRGSRRDKEERLEKKEKRREKQEKNKHKHKGKGKDDDSSYVKKEKRGKKGRRSSLANSKDDSKASNTSQMTKDEALKLLMEEEERSRSLIESLSPSRVSSGKSEKNFRKGLLFLRLSSLIMY